MVLRGVWECRFCGQRCTVQHKDVGYQCANKSACAMRVQMEADRKHHESLPTYVVGNDYGGGNEMVIYAGQDFDLAWKRFLDDDKHFDVKIMVAWVSGEDERTVYKDQDNNLCWSVRPY